MKLFDFDKLINTLTGYIETRIEILKIDIKEGLSSVITKLMLLMILSAIGFFVVLFVFLGLSAILNNALNSHYLGYLLVAGFFAIALFIVLISRDKMMEILRKKIEDAQEND